MGEQTFKEWFAEKGREASLQHRSGIVKGYLMAIRDVHEELSENPLSRGDAEAALSKLSYEARRLEREVTPNSRPQF